MFVALVLRTRVPLLAQRTLLRGGRVVTAEQDRIADILIEGERIVAVGPDLPDTDVDVVDVTGRLVLPGAIDLHVHFEEPGPTRREGYATGTSAAAAGGITMVVEHPLSDPPTTTAANFAAKLRIVAPSAVVDFGLWGGAIPGNAGELAGMADLGAAGFKAFMVGSEPDYPRLDGPELRAAMAEVARIGSTLVVHAEDHDMVEQEAARLQGLGRLDPAAWAESRPEASEVVAVERALKLARETGCRLHLVHVSVPAAARAAADARASGLDVGIESVLHHLLLDESATVRLGPIAKCSPPLRPSLTVEALWQALADGTIDFIASDHAPWEPWEKAEGDDDIWRAPNGCQSLQFLMVLGLDAWQRRGGTISRWVALTATAPARWLGAYPRKGTLEPGSDADLAVYQVGPERHVSPAELRNKHRWTPFEGLMTRYTIEATMVRGRWVYRDGAVVEPGTGRYVPLGPAALAARSIPAGLGV